jgi:hypothetical protein
MIWTSYFTGRPDPQRDRRVLPDRYDYFSTLHQSAHDVGMGLLVFHDSLSPSFVAQYEGDGLAFVKVRPPWCSTNDYRFFCYHRHMEKTKPDGAIFLTDCSDVIVQERPVIERGVIYTGGSADHIARREGQNPWTVEHYGINRFISVPDERYPAFFGHPDTEALPIHNAGVVGGDAGIVREMLAAMVREFLLIGDPSGNWNMAVLNYVLHREFNGRTITGFPVCGSFRCDTGPGCWFLHVLRTGSDLDMCYEGSG